MVPKDVLKTLLLFLLSSLVPAEGFLLPLLFPVSIKITIHSSSSHHKPAPPPKPDYYFSTIPVYKEVVVKGTTHFSGPGNYKKSYGDGHKYGTSYGDGQLKVYTEDHRKKKGYDTASHYPATELVGHYKGTSFEAHAPVGHFKGTEYVAPEGHYKGTEYAAPVPDGHYKGTQYDAPAPDGHYKGTQYAAPAPEGHYKGTQYATPAPEGHYKGTQYADPAPEGHYKGTQYADPAPEGHYKGTQYAAPAPEGHFKGTSYETPEGHYKGKPYRKKVYTKNHSFIKAVQGYKMADYVPNNGQECTHDDGQRYISHVAIPPKVEPGHSYAEIAKAHREQHAPKAYEAKEYADLGAYQHKPQQEYSDETSADYLDDSLPAYKYPPTRYAYRSGLVATEPTTYAGYGTTFYGDSYAKIVYQPKSLRISIRPYRH